MHRLDDIFKISQQILAGETPQEIPDGESATFNAAWLTFMTMASDRTELYTGLWKVGGRMLLDKPIEAMSVKSVKSLAHLVTISYITCGLDCALAQRTALMANPQERFSEIIAPKLMLIAGLGLLIKRQPIPFTPGGKIPAELRNALGEFYSLSLFAMTEMKGSLSSSFHHGIEQAIEDFKYTSAHHDLPRLLNADARNVELAALSGVSLMPKRPGIALAAPDMKAAVVDFSKALRRNTAKNTR